MTLSDKDALARAEDYLHRAGCVDIAHDPDRVTASVMLAIGFSLFVIAKAASDFQEREWDRYNAEHSGKPLSEYR